MEAPDEHKMLDAPPADAEDEQDEDDGPLQIGSSGRAPETNDNGLLGASTLAALQGFKAASTNREENNKSAGPLVGYGSDSDDDD